MTINNSQLSYAGCYIELGTSI